MGGWNGEGVGVMMGAANETERGREGSREGSGEGEATWYGLVER